MQGSRSIIILAATLGLLAGSAMGVTAQGEGTASVPVEFRGHPECGPEVRHGTDTRDTFEIGDGRVFHTASHGYTWRPTATMSDPRLEGTYYGSIE